MAQFQHLPLYHKFYHLTKYLHERTRNFPKQYKYTLGQCVLDLSWNCLDLLAEANSFQKKEKYNKILELSIMFDRFKIRLRMTQEIGLISEKQFIYIQVNYTKEIGSMIGGWLKWGETNC